MRSRVALGLFMVAVAAITVLVVTLVSEPERVLGVDESALASSLARESGDGGDGACTLQAGESWYWCGVEVDAGSGIGRTYRLEEAEDEGCWTAVQASARQVEGPSKGVTLETRGGSLASCVALQDYVMPDTLDGGLGQLDIAD